MANDLELTQVTGTQNNKYVTSNDGDQELGAAIAGYTTVSVSTTSPVIIAKETYLAASIIKLIDDGGTPPVADFDVQLEERNTSGYNRGPLFIWNATSFNVTNLTVDSQPSAALSLSVGHVRAFGVLDDRMIELQFGAPADSIGNAELENGKAWAIKLRNAGTTGDFSNVDSADITEDATPVAGDLLFGWLSTGEARVFDVGNLPTGTSLVDFKDSVRCATTANITLSGEQTIDGVTTSADRVLVKNQSTGSENGLYVSAAGAWTRATDFDADAEVTAGAAVVVEEGSTNGDKLFLLTTNDPITVGSTALTFSAVSGGGASALNDLTDVVIASAAAGDLLIHDGTDWDNKSINDLTADATPNGATDYVMTWDASASDNKKVLLDNLPGGGGGGGGVESGKATIENQDFTGGGTAFVWDHFDDLATDFDETGWWNNTNKRIEPDATAKVEVSGGIDLSATETQWGVRAAHYNSSDVLQATSLEFRPGSTAGNDGGGFPTTVFSVVSGDYIQLETFADAASYTTMRGKAELAWRDVSAAAANTGQQTIYTRADEMIARTTAGAASGTVETTTNRVMLQTLNFDATADEFAQFSIQMPKSWNEGTLICQFIWSHPSTATNFDVVWGIQAVAFANDDAADTAFGTAVTVTDTGGTTDDIYITAETAAMTVAGTPGAEEWVVFQVYRDADAGGDTLAVDARLHGVKIHYTTDAATDD